ncbi:hypothetical protein [Selenomonas sp. ND2010]|jgi:hypothetical protein|uniref:hypothetical protein n=1 Tax=Selenomonas sp. ND2010 TaxID=1410618 RepID=UPI000690396C|nr:hypothetical protein [Selenomonas sp. ND2010]
MDVKGIASLSQQTAALSASYKKTTTSTTTDAEKNLTTTTTTSEAFSIDISASAQKASGALKGMTSEQVDALKDGIQKSYQLMIKTMTEQNAKLQGWLDQGIGALNFEGILFGTDKFALPPVGTTPEEAQAAISDGGEYSVDAVATRIFDMASTIAGGDPEKLKAMQAAVEEGFKQAGIVWKDAIGDDEMPQITKDTHAEITKRFEELYAKLTNPNQDE